MNENLLFPYQATELTMREMQQRGIPVTMENLRIQKNREEEMRMERQRYQKILDEAATQRAKEFSKGKARRTQDDSDEDEDKKERLRKVLEAKGSQEKAKKHQTGHRAVARSYRATSRVNGSVSGCILPIPVRPYGLIA
ncbi:hypothetical protein PIB30_096629 [Stylosanthes scabra]|uniref:Uncharacterized protein n=1 Tax=Stylosanthes scabra TaxID=79078 RepID=A0ABU6VVV6_9FABA|nr:hypothetical protein [Stylosanthes scabra]